MGFWKEYIPIKILKQLGGLALVTDWGQTPVSCTTYKSLSGAEKTQIHHANYWGGTAMSGKDALKRNRSLFNGLTPYATADLLTDYNVNDYQISAVGTTTFTRTNTYSDGAINSLFTLTVTNTDETSIVVNCVKFKKTIYPKDNTGNGIECLAYSYFLNNPMTIQPNNSAQIEISIKNDLASGNLNVRVFDAAYSCITWMFDNVLHLDIKDIDGNTLSINPDEQSGYRFVNNGIFTIYKDLIPVGTTDLLVNYNKSDYAASDAVTTTYVVESNTLVGNVRTITYTITFTNNGNSDINISCIKFKKVLKPDTYSLMYGYYILDANGNQDYITVPAGGVKKYQFTMTI